MDGSKVTIQLTKDIIPETTSYGVKISGDSMEPEFEDRKITWVLKQDMVENGEINLLSNNLKTIRESRGLLQEYIASATGFCTKLSAE